jgi:SAM-dependent methyltransferase
MAHDLGTAESLPFDREFDAVFSNAMLHWTRDIDAVLAGVYRALVPGGRFVGEFGGDGNTTALVAATEAVMMRRGQASVCRAPASVRRRLGLVLEDERIAQLHRHGRNAVELRLGLRAESPFEVGHRRIQGQDFAAAVDLDAFAARKHHGAKRLAAILDHGHAGDANPARWRAPSGFHLDSAMGLAERNILTGHRSS